MLPRGIRNEKGAIPSGITPPVTSWTPQGRSPALPLTSHEERQDYNIGCLFSCQAVLWRYFTAMVVLFRRDSGAISP